MSLADELLERAERLAEADPTRPRQVNLRGAVHSAYYALFHRLIEEGVSAVVGGDTTLRNSMSRWYAHGRMKDVSNWFRGVTAPREIVGLLGIASTMPTGIVPVELVRVATAFVELQEARHRADYDVGARFTRVEARERVKAARRAFADWKTVRGLPCARLYLLLLLTGKEPVQSR